MYSLQLCDEQLTGEIASQIGSCLTILGRHDEAMVYHLKYWTVTKSCANLPRWGVMQLKPLFCSLDHQVRV